MNGPLSLWFTHASPDSLVLIWQPQSALALAHSHTSGSREKENLVTLSAIPQVSPVPTPSDGLPSAEFCWDSGSRDRKVPSSDTWDFSVSLSMPGWDTGGREGTCYSTPPTQEAECSPFTAEVVCLSFRPTATFSSEPRSVHVPPLTPTKRPRPTQFFHPLHAVEFLFLGFLVRNDPQRSHPPPDRAPPAKPHTLPA